jgi:hypothetical protein
LLGLFFDPVGLGGGDMFLRKRRLIFNGLHSVISQKIVLFITTVVRISNPTDTPLRYKCLIPRYYLKYEAGDV